MTTDNGSAVNETPDEANETPDEANETPDEANDTPDEDVLPAIPVSAGALIFDRSGWLLILKPTYKSGWTIPGGVMEADGESPWEACRREVAEECGLDVATGRLVCMDFRRPRPGNQGGIRYLFDCGAFSDASLAGIVVQPEEISEYRLAEPAQAITAVVRGQQLASALALARGTDPDAPAHLTKVTETT